ncbi:MAG: peptide chain release factor 1 [Proteobacteria bacterium]|nr:peptide chain release factor 1 [Pseudomonadota bacterium]
MFEKLDSIERRFDEIEAALSQDGLDSKEMTKLSKERALVLEVVNGYRLYRSLLARRDDAKAMLNDESDEGLRDLAKEELAIVSTELAVAERELTVSMLPKDPNDSRNVMLEVRAGTGGDEAGIFAGDLYRMYMRYAAKARWKTEVLSSTSSERGGFREIVVMIEGDKVFSRLKFESGVHRVQRVPETEAQGRVHTSACTVAILPEADEVEVEIKPQDLEISVCRSSGAGGQSVNTSDSAVRIVHKPTGLVVECQDERSQLKNKGRALKILTARLYEKAQREQDAEISAARKSLVGSGDRSERIRTYNFPQGRLTDHRINYTVYNLAEVIEGDLDDVLDKLGNFYQAELLKFEINQH